MSTPLDPELERLLQAAAEEINHFGFRRTSINDVARRAGVSRPTAYRRLGGKDTLLQFYLATVAHAFWSEWQEADINADSVAERAGDLFLTGMRTAHAHPGVARLLKEDPELVVRAWTASDNQQLARIREDIALSLDPAHTLTEAQARRAAELLQRLGLSFLANPSELFDEPTLRSAALPAIRATTEPQ